MGLCAIRRFIFDRAFKLEDAQVGDAIDYFAVPESSRGTDGMQLAVRNEVTAVFINEVKIADTAHLMTVRHFALHHIYRNEQHWIHEPFYIRVT